MATWQYLVTTKRLAGLAMSYVLYLHVVASSESAHGMKWRPAIFVSTVNAGSMSLSAYCTCLMTKKKPLHMHTHGTRSSVLNIMSHMSSIEAQAHNIKKFWTKWVSDKPDGRLRGWCQWVHQQAPSWQHPWISPLGQTIRMWCVPISPLVLKASMPHLSTHTHTQHNTHFQWAKVCFASPGK